MATYQIKDLDKLLKKVSKDLINKSDKALLQAGLYLEGKLREGVKEDSYDRGEFARSINTRLTRPGVVAIGSNLIYAVTREYGRKPGTFPNFDAIAWWTRRKGMTNSGSSYDGMSSEDRSIVYLVARKIKLQGTPAQYTFKKVFEREKQKTYQIYMDNMKK